MAAEDVLRLFDSYWFERIILSKEPLSLPHATTNPVHQIQEEIQEQNFSRLPTLHFRSLSDQFLTSRTIFSSGSFSPNYGMTTPKLQTIISGKEILEFSKENLKQEEIEIPIMKKVSKRKSRRKLGSARSLSDLEFEELKGFMDLGFVFSEEDKDSRLVSIIPGLRRLGRKGGGEDGEEEGETDETLVSRPYLYEAWDILDLRKVEYPLMNWKIPTLGNEMDMKDKLKFWAHTVASTVR